MAGNRYHKDRIGNHKLKPETLMLGYGYDPTLSEGAVKPPVFLTSTFVFNSAEHGKEFFDYVAGRRDAARRAQALDRLFPRGVSDRKLANLLEAPLSELFHGVDVVFHLAGQPGVRPSWGAEFATYTARNVLLPCAGASGQATAAGNACQPAAGRVAAASTCPRDA